MPSSTIFTYRLTSRSKNRKDQPGLNSNQAESKIIPAAFIIIIYRVGNKDEQVKVQSLNGTLRLFWTTLYGANFNFGASSKYLVLNFKADANYEPKAAYALFIGNFLLSNLCALLPMARWEFTFETYIYQWRTNEKKLNIILAF